MGFLFRALAKEETHELTMNAKSMQGVSAYQPNLVCAGRANKV